MPSTTIFGWTTPADTDLVKDGANAIRTLADGIDTTVASRQANLVPVETGYYLQTGADTVSNSLTQTKQQTYYVPIYVPSATFDRISIGSGTAHSGSIPTRLGIYANSSANKPSTLILDAGTVTVTAAGTNYEITINQTLTNGWYWLAINGQSATGTMSINSITSGKILQSSLLFNAIAGAISYFGYVQTGVTGAFANAGTLSITNRTPLVNLRIA